MEKNKKKALCILVLTWVIIIGLYLVVALTKVGYTQSILITIVAGIVGLTGVFFTLKTAFSKSSK